MDLRIKKPTRIASRRNSFSVANRHLTFVLRILAERFFSHPVVELGLTGLTSTSTNIRTTASSPLRYLSPVIQSWAFALTSFSSWARHRRNGVRFPKRPHDSFRVPSLSFKFFSLWRIFQRSISERDVSHPMKLSSKKQRLKPFEFSPHGLSDRLRLNCEPSSPLNAFSHILILERSIIFISYCCVREFFNNCTEEWL